MATNVEVYWPDGVSVARPLEPSEINSVLEIHYPKDDDEVTPTVEIEVQWSHVVTSTLTPLEHKNTLFLSTLWGKLSFSCSAVPALL